MGRSSWHEVGCCLAGDTVVPLLNGKERALLELANGMEGASCWVYSCDGSGRIVPGRAQSARLMRRNAELVEVVLDNETSIRCTPDHLFLLRNGDYREAGTLQVGDSLMPLYRRYDATSLPGYERIYVPGIRRWRYTHREVAGFMAGGRYSGMVHHADFDRLNNSPDNLEVMSWEEHSRLHAKLSKALIEYNQSSRGRAKSRENMESIWSDPVLRAKIVAKMAAANRRNGELKRGVPKTPEQINAVSAALRELYSTDNEARDRAKARACSASAAAAEKTRRHGITDAQRAARRENMKRLMAARYPNNHKVVSVMATKNEDVYSLSVDGFHNFALAAGVIVHNC